MKLSELKRRVAKAENMSLENMEGEGMSIAELLYRARNLGIFHKGMRLEVDDKEEPEKLSKTA